ADCLGGLAPAGRLPRRHRAGVELVADPNALRGRGRWAGSIRVGRDAATGAGNPAEPVQERYLHHLDALDVPGIRRHVWRDLVPDVLRADCAWADGYQLRRHPDADDAWLHREQHRRRANALTYRTVQDSGDRWLRGWRHRDVPALAHDA